MAGETASSHQNINNPKLISKKVAIRLGALRYFTGVACIHGHVAERLVANRTCVVCIRGRVKLWQKANPDITKVWLDRSRKKYEELRPDRVHAAKLAYKQRNKAKTAEYAAGRYPKIKLQMAARKKQYRRAKPWIHAKNQRTRELRKRRAMPPWVDQNEILTVYRRAHELSLETGVVHSVDHIYPIAGNTSSGLHVPWNLQIITLAENCRKGRKPPV